MKPDRKAAQSDFHHLVKYVIDELRYIYAGVLANTPITMEVWEISGGEETQHTLTPLLPVWEEGSVKDYGEIPLQPGRRPADHPL